jgi:hypothetical protein
MKPCLLQGLSEGILLCLFVASGGCRVGCSRAGSVIYCSEILHGMSPSTIKSAIDRLHSLSERWIAKPMD